MATIADLDVEKLKQHLIGGGFFTPFTDIFGNSQPAPKRQINELDLTPSKSKAERIIMLRNVGGAGNANERQHYKVRNMIIVVVSLPNSSDDVIVQGLAEDIDKYLVDNFQNEDQCIFNINSSGVTGPFIMEDSHRAYEVNLQIYFNR